MELTNQTQILLDFEPLIIKTITTVRKIHTKQIRHFKNSRNLHRKNYLPITIFQYAIKAKDIQAQN